MRSGQWRRRLLGVSVRIKIMGIGLGMLVLLSLGMVGYVHLLLSNILEEDLKARGVSLAYYVAAQSAALQDSDSSVAYRALGREALARFDDVIYVQIPTNESPLLVRAAGFSAPIANSELAPDPGCVESRSLVSESGLAYWDITVCTADGTQTVRVGMTRRHIREQIARTTKHLLGVTLLTALVGTVAAYLLATSMTRPIQELEQIARRVGTRDFSGRATVQFDDEVGRLTAAFSEMIEKLAESQAAIESYNKDLRKRDESRKQLLHQVMVAQEEERHRIARELHDETSQLLAALSVSLGSLETIVRRGGNIGENQIQSTQQMAKDVLNEVRRMIQNLRPVMLDDLGLAAAIRWWIQQCSFQSQAEFTLQLPDESRLLALRHPTLEAAEAQVHLFRVIQEAVTNVLRHASAETASVSMQFEGEGLHLRITDDGVGFDKERVLENETATGHFGLRGIAERIELLGGTLEIISSPGNGTQIIVEVPVVVDMQPLMGG